MEPIWKMHTSVFHLGTHFSILVIFFSGIFTIYKYSRVIQIMALSSPVSKLKGCLPPSGNPNSTLNILTSLQATS